MHAAGKLAWGRIAAGGTVAGAVIAATNALKEAWIPAFAEQWNATLTRLGLEASTSPTGPVTLLLFAGTSLAYGLAMVWVYAAMVPRFGASPGTGVAAGALVWLVGYLLPMAGYAGLGIFSGALLMFSSGLAAVQFLLAALAGTSIYRDKPASMRPDQPTLALD